MLNSNQVLSYVKDNLGFPFMKLELEDTKIMEFIQTYSLKEFSYYIPEVKWLGLNLDLVANHVPGRSNEFYIEEPQGLEILNVTDIYFSGGDLFLFGHPPLGPLCHGELREWALLVETSMQTKMFSSFDRTFRFIHPNMVRISPVPNNMGYCTVEYERMQSPDFSGVPNDVQRYFLDLALADIMIVIGRIRKKYSGGNLRTPFGEIPLEAEIFEEGKDKKREVLEKLQAGPMMNVVFDRG